MPLMPPWMGMHPMVVHFPIVLLLVAPLFVALALYRREPTGPYAVTAWVLLVLGMVAAWVATMTGEAAAALLIPTDTVTKALEKHSDLGEFARDAATVTTLLLSALLGWARFLKKTLAPRTVYALMGLVFAASLAGAVLAGMAGHAGAYLVHGLGVTNVASFPPTAP